jgi:hypothetical protein
MATATSGIGWVVALQCEGPWAPKTLETPALAGPLRERLAALEAALPLRVQLLRRGAPDTATPPGAGASDCVVLTARVAADGSGWVRRRRVRSPEEVASWSEVELLAGPSASEERVAEPVVLVCTHGRRDRCCARHGRSVFEDLAQTEGLEVWQTSHLGGHRFAATALVLPSGVMLGRLGEVPGGHVAAALREGRIPELACYRGNVTLPEPAQAAEHALRGERGELRATAVRVEACEAAGPSAWQVRLRHGGMLRTYAVHQTRGSVLRPMSCGKEPEPTTHWRVVGVDVEPVA